MIVSAPFDNWWHNAYGLDVRIISHPHMVLDPATSANARALIEMHAPAAHELPLVVCPDGVVKKNPGIDELGRCLGLLPELDPEKVYDVIVVGAGPSGLLLQDHSNQVWFKNIWVIPRETP